MIIRSDNKSLTFEIVGYQFPNYKSPDGDYSYKANRLLAKVTYSDDNRTKEWQVPCLLTREVEEMINGLSAVIGGNKNLFISDFLGTSNLRFIAAKVNDAIFVGIEVRNDKTWKKLGLSEVIDKEKSKQIVNEMKSISSLFPYK